ncbi:MAG: ZIP family metal transporter [Chloroflexi bacterium]|nr:ZIP family metal transporter [Chloroflexota bacterium]
MVLIQILVATFVISLIAFVGVLTFILKEEWLKKALLILVALSSGALLGGAFLHLIPEAVSELGGSLSIFLYLLLGFCLFFILEQFLHWRHQHDETHSVKPFTYLILVSDSLHNFIDGLVIAASFVVSYPVGIATTLAVALHEIPQELDDFGALVYGGFGRKRALAFNYVSAITAIVGGVTGYFAASVMKASIVYLLPFAAGNFIYIAAADLIPEIKHAVNIRRSIIHFCVFLAGIGVMLLVKFIH